MLNQSEPGSILRSLWWTVSQPTALCTGLVAYVAWKAAYALYFSPLRNIPGRFVDRVSNLPWFVAMLRGELTDKALISYETRGNVFVMANKMVAVCDPNDCRSILATHVFRKDRLYAHIDFVEPNMFLTRDPELNKQRRRQVGPAFSITNLRKMEPTIISAGIQQLLDKWNGAIEQSPGGKAKVCYEKDFLLMTFDIISSLGFGKTHRSLRAGDLTVVRWVKQSIIMTVMKMATGGLKWLPFNHLLIKPLRRDVEEFIAFANRSIEERKQLLTKGAVKPDDILQAYIDGEDPESKIKMTQSQVTSEVILTFLAGADTSSNTLTWTIHLLMLHPQHHRRAVDEVRFNFDKDHLITFTEAKEKLPYLEACVYESMRICPVTPPIPRIVPPGGVTLQGHFIPEGYTCMVAIPAANMNKDVWDKPRIFNPERFIGNEENKRNMLTFSSGDALFTPDKLDKHGQPQIMPQKMTIVNASKFPERDCQIVISKRQN
ncbi:cytochrome P450 [Martensiomyces pterosporus]|nr:cytochrome P450 [Martensiomyces pterosporus]